MNQNIDNTSRETHYVPASLSELNDQITVMIFEAPTFNDDSGAFGHRNIESEFFALTKGLERLRMKLSEEHYAAALDLANRAKALFAADQDDTNGKTDEGRELLFQIEDLLRDVRRRRVDAKQVDEEGEVSGD